MDWHFTDTQVADCILESPTHLITTYSSRKWIVKQIVKCKNVKQKTDLGIITHILAYSDISRHEQEYLGIFIHVYSEPFVTLAYSELWYIQNPGIFKTRGIFKTLVYIKLWHIKNQAHIQNPVLLRILGYSEQKAYSEPVKHSL